MAALSDSVKSFQVLAVNQSCINAASDAGVTVAHLASLSKAGKVCKLLHQNNVSFTIATHDFFHYDHIKIIAGTTALELIGATLDTIPASERKQSALDEIQFFLRRKLARSESDQSAATTPKPINKSQEDFAKIRDLSEQYRRAREIKKAQEDQEKEQLRIKEEESHRRMKEGIEQRRKERENIKIAEEAKNRQDEERRRKNFEARQKRDAARQFSTSSQQPTPAPELERPHSSTPLVNLSDNQTLIDELIGLEERKVKQLQELGRTSVGSYNYEEKSKRINAAFARDVKSYMIQSIEDPTASEQLKIKRSKLKIHPDKNPGNEEKANRAMKIMGDAFAILDTRSSFR